MNVSSRYTGVFAAVFGAVLAGLPLLLLSGCGLPAAPAPPSLKLPEPPTDLNGFRAGNEVHLSWTMPKRTTDKLPLKGLQRARICRHMNDSPCQPADIASFPPDGPATYIDYLPASIASGSPRPLVYTVELLNHAGKTAGDSNALQLAAGTALPKIENLTATARHDGILLQWTPVIGADSLIRMHRVLKPAPARDGKPAPKTPVADTLEVHVDGHARAIDRTAVLDSTYTYTLERVDKVRIASGVTEILGEASAPFTIDAKDTFPPTVPEAVQAVADPDAHAVDISWAPNADDDLAGYLVYRRDVSSSAEPARISDAKPAMAPSFRDAHPEAGHRYAYSVSAVDKDGNESRRSTETEEALP